MFRTLKHSSKATGLLAFVMVFLFQSAGGTVPASLKLQRKLDQEPINHSFQAAPAAANIFYKQPNITDPGTVTQMVNGGVPLEAIPKGVIQAPFYGLGPNVNNPVSWDVGRFTGFRPTNLGNFQRGAVNQDGQSAVQIQNNEIGIYLTTQGLDVGWNGFNLTNTPAVWYDSSSLNPFPFRVPGQAIGYSCWLKVPTVERRSGTDVYADLYFMFEDQITRHRFWYGIAVFDVRPPAPDHIHFDPVTQLPIVLTALVDQSAWVTRAPGSTAAQQLPFSDYRFFDARITRLNFEGALSAMRNAHPELGLSSDPANYQLVHFNFNPEVHDTQPPPPRPTHLYFRAATQSAGLMQVFFKTDSSPQFTEDKSLFVQFPTGGGWRDAVLDMSAHPQWKGTITGLRIDPFQGAGNFAFDYVYVGDSNRNYVQRWEFNGATQVSNPFQGWTQWDITQTWTDGNLWGGKTINGDPYFWTNTSLTVNPSDNAFGRMGVTMKDLTITLYDATPPPQLVYDQVYIRGANASTTPRLQVFFKTAIEDFYSEDKSLFVPFPTGGGWQEVIADMSLNPKWKGRITGLRVDPMQGTGHFGIDYVYLGDRNRNYAYRWEFNGSSQVGNPFQGWTLWDINQTWTDGNLWGGGTVNGDPYFHINIYLQLNN